MRSIDQRSRSNIEDGISSKTRNIINYFYLQLLDCPPNQSLLPKILFILSSGWCDYLQFKSYRELQIKIIKYYHHHQKKKGLLSFPFKFTIYIHLLILFISTAYIYKKKNSNNICIYFALLEIEAKHGQKPTTFIHKNNNHQ